MKISLFLAGLLGITGVALGAFGAHALRETLAASGHERAWSSAVLYHLIHTVAIYATALARPKSRAFGWACWAWIAGVVLFSGSLYCLSLGGPSWLGPVTPLGGLAFIVGWVLAAIGAKGMKESI